MADQRPAGTIYDLGYQRYTGDRRGRGYVFRTLVGHSFLVAFGRGRGEKAHLIPFLALVLCFLPAIVQVGIASAAGRPEMINYAQQLELSAFFIALFIAAQGPELIVADRETGTRSLYLSRSLHTADYALAKLVALVAAILVLTFVPQFLMFLGKITLSPTPWDAFVKEYGKLLPIIGGTLLASIYMAAIGLSLAAFANKRNAAAGMVIAFFIVLPALSALAVTIASEATKKYMVLGNPFVVMSGFAYWLFDLQAKRGTLVDSAGLKGPMYLWVVAGTCVVALTALLWRYWKAEE